MGWAVRAVTIHELQKTKTRQNERIQVKLLNDILVWLKAGINDGQALFWAGIGLYVIFVLLLWENNFAPINVQMGAVMTLSVLAFSEASVKFATWCATQEDHPHKADLARWATWARPFIGIHIAFAWILALYFGHAAPLDAILIGLALCMFGLAKTLPGINISGRLGNGILLVSIALPCFMVAGIGHAFGL